MRTRRERDGVGRGLRKFIETDFPFIMIAFTRLAPLEREVLVGTEVIIMVYVFVIWSAVDVTVRMRDLIPIIAIFNSNKLNLWEITHTNTFP